MRQAELVRLTRCMSYGLALRNLHPSAQLGVFRYSRAKPSCKALNADASCFEAHVCATRIPQRSWKCTGTAGPSLKHCIPNIPNS